MGLRLILLLATAMALSLPAVPVTYAAAAVPAWTTYRHDAARSGIDPDSASPVTASQAWRTPALDGEVYAQPLIYGSHVYVATENDTVYELDAATGAVVWAKHLATPEPESAAPCGDISPSIGITGTPVIDPATNRIYAVGAVSAAGAIQHELFALNLSSGQPIAGFPINVDPPSLPEADRVNQLQRAGLALDGGRILIGYGGNNGDCATYWGWVVSAPTNGTTALTDFQADAGAGHHAGAVWASGNAPAVDAAGNAFIATGNGSGNTSTTDPDFGDAVVKLNAAASPPLDWWAPTNWRTLDRTDADLGSSMPTLLPRGFLFQSGKDGNGYIVNGAHLGNVSAPASQVSGFCSGGSFGGSVFEPANSTIYAACKSGLKALTLGSGSPPSISTKAGFSAPPGATGPPMIAGGLVWATNPGGTLYALDPTSGAARRQFSIPENGSQVNQFASPSAGGGRLFVASGNQVTAFTIAHPPPPTPTSTTLASSASPALAGAGLALTAAVAPAPEAGTVTFTDGGAPIAGCAGIAVSAATAGRAVCHTALGAAGTHDLRATYSGDAFFGASASAVLAELITSPPSGARPAPRRASSRAPRISHASIRPRRFRAGHTATLRLTLSEAATLTVAITRTRHGHRRAHHRCSPKAHRGKRCVLRVRVQRKHYRAHAGRDRIKLALRRLRPGSYTAVIHATDRAGRNSRTIRIKFTVLPRRHRRR